MGNYQALLRFFGIAAAAGMAALTGTAHAQSGGAFAAPAARQVFMRDVPNASPKSMAAFRVHPRPRTGMPESTYQALKAQAASPHGVPAADNDDGETSAATGPEERPGNPGSNHQFRRRCGIRSLQLRCAGRSSPRHRRRQEPDPPGRSTYAFPSGTPLERACSAQWTWSAFFGLPAGTFTSDPRALYDWYNHRFIVTLLDTSCPSPPCATSTNNYNIAVSQSDDPTLGWWILNSRCRAQPTLFTTFQE